MPIYYYKKGPSLLRDYKDVVLLKHKKKTTHE